MSDISELRAWAAEEQSEQLDDLLSRWHHWRSGYQLVRGYEGGGNVTSDYLTSRQYDDSNGALDDAIECRIMEQVEFQVSELSALHQAAIMANARGLYCGASVWSHPRLPSDNAERWAVIEQARERLTARLVAAGVM